MLLPFADAAQAAEPITGRASVIDGDTIEIESVLIGLAGVAAFEPDQDCLDAAGNRYPCGQRASLALADLLEDRTLTCVPKDETSVDPIVAVCWLGANDLGGWLVLQGWALDKSAVEPDYSAEEAAAKRAGAGAWAGKFEAPSQWQVSR